MAIQVRSDVLVAHLDGETVLLDLDTKNYFHLNTTASAVWKGLEAGKGREELIKGLRDQFEVEVSEAEQGVDLILDQLVSRNLVRVSPE